MKKILFVCTGNSARSIMTEVLMNHHGGGRYRAFSAGARPTGKINPLTLDTLKTHGHNTDGLRSKSIDEFSGEHFDLVITVCDNARETCLVWPENTDLLHWSFPDPAARKGTDSDKKRFFADIFREIERKIMTFLNEQV